MKRLLLCLGTLGAIVASCSGQTTRPGEIDLAPGFKLRPVGDIDIGPAFAEVNYYSDRWVISQQHDKFTPAATPPDAAPPGARVVAGVLSTANGPANYQEQIAPADGGIDFSATFDSDKPLTTNELSETFILPKSAFAGKIITVDGTPLTLGDATPTTDKARLSEKDDAHTVILPLPGGTLTLTGHFHFLIQDDQAWGDPRYSMRLYYSPGSGPITHSEIRLQMRLKTND